MEPEKGGSAKDLFKLIVHSPALLVTFLVGIALVIYFLVKYGPSSSSTSGSGGVSGAAAPTATVIPQTSIYIPQGHVWNQSGPGQTDPTTGQVTTPSQVATPPSASAPPGPVATTPAVPSPVASGPIAYTDQSGQPTSTVPYEGLIGANAQVNFQNRTYTVNGKQVPLPSYVGNLIQGSQNRVWYIDKTTGKQDLLTSGVGPGVTNSGYAPGSPQNTPVKTG